MGGDLLVFLILLVVVLVAGGNHQQPLTRIGLTVVGCLLAVAYGIAYLADCL